MGYSVGDVFPESSFGDIELEAVCSLLSALRIFKRM